VETFVLGIPHYREHRKIPYYLFVQTLTATHQTKNKLWENFKEGCFLLERPAIILHVNAEQ
jgi:hypothetical protein